MSDERPQEAAAPVADDAAVFVISVAAELAGMHAQTLRQYDRLGLVSPGRTRAAAAGTARGDVALLREVQRLSQEDGVNLAGIKRIIDLESQVEALQARVHELLDELEVAESRRIAAETDRAGDVGDYRRDSCRRAGRARHWSSGAPGSTGERHRPTPHEAFVRLEREIGLLLRRSRAISARLAGELHPDLDGAAYGLLVPAPGRRPAARQRPRGPHRAWTRARSAGRSPPGRPRARRPRGRPRRRPGPGAHAVGGGFGPARPHPRRPAGALGGRPLRLAGRPTSPRSPTCCTG